VTAERHAPSAGSQLIGGPVEPPPLACPMTTGKCAGLFGPLLEQSSI